MPAAPPGLSEERVRQIIQQEMQLLRRESLPASTNTKQATGQVLKAVQTFDVTSRTKLTLDDKPPTPLTYLQADGNGFATYAAGPVGPTGPAGPTGPTGPTGPPNVLNNRLAGALIGTGLEDFALYSALREARRAALGTAANYLVSWPYNPSTLDAAANTVTLTSGRLFLCPQLVRAGEAIDGVTWIQTTPGNYTPNNSNQVAAYTFDGTTFTRVALSTSAGTMWQAAAGQQVQAFTSSGQLAAFGSDTIVWAAGLLNYSAFVTRPAIVGPGPPAAATGLGLGVYALEVDIASTVNAPASFLASAATYTFVNHPWLAFYRNYA